MQHRIPKYLGLVCANGYYSNDFYFFYTSYPDRHFHTIHQTWRKSNSLSSFPFDKNSSSFPLVVYSTKPYDNPIETIRLLTPTYTRDWCIVHLDDATLDSYHTIDELVAAKKLQLNLTCE